MATTKLKGVQIFDGTITAADIDDTLEKEFTKARVTTDDSTSDFLSSKITAGANIQINVVGAVNTNQTLSITGTIDNSIVATVSGTTFTGVTNHSAGLSGSLTKLTNGTSYLIAGSNTSITTGALGAVTIAATPAGSTTQVQYNSAGSFAGSANFTFNGSSAFLTGTFAQGINAKATGTSSHAEGNLTMASGQRSHAEGDNTTASGISSHAEGYSTTAQGAYSHAQGDNTVTIGLYSHAAGTFTIASGSGQSVVGKYNKRGNTDSLFIVGNGSGITNERRDDIFLVNSGSVLVGSGNISSDTAFFVTGPSNKNKSVFQGDMVVSGNIYGRYAGNNVLTNSSIGRIITSITSSYSNVAPATTAGAVVANITLPAYTFINTGDRARCTFEIDGQGTLGTRTVNTYFSGSSGRTQIGFKTNAGTSGATYVNDFSITRTGANSQIARGAIIDSATSLPTRISGSTSHDETQAMYVILELTASSVATDTRLISYGVTFQGT